MKLLTKALRDQLPALYANEKKEADDIKTIVKFFHPFSNWRWYATEFDGDDLFFGWVAGDFPELGYFRLSELESIRVMGLPMERDRYWSQASLGEVMRGEKV